MPRDEMTFVEFLSSFRRGELVAAADDRWHELLEAVRATGGGGVLTLKLPVKVNKGGQVEIDPDVTVKKPLRSLGSGIYYLTDEGRLTRRDPDQPDLIDEIEARRARDTNT